MSEPIVYVDTSEVRPGKLGELQGAIGELAEFVKAEEPRLLSYNVYFDEAGTRMTVFHVHPDSESLEHHLRVVGPRLPHFKDLIRLKTLEVYGRPSPALRGLLEAKARLLGTARLAVHERHAGFVRTPIASPPR